MPRKTAAILAIGEKTRRNREGRLRHGYSCLCCGNEWAKKRDIARGFIDRLQDHDIFLTVQALGELFQILVRKGQRSRAEARKTILIWRDA